MYIIKDVHIINNLFKILNWSNFVAINLFQQH